DGRRGGQCAALARPGAFVRGQMARNRKRPVANGIAAGRITTKGFGSSKPVSPNDTDENRRANRRVEFTVETM
ncbi:MAG TPA: hypothetical protein PLE73_13275, partial [Spirochaetota bacterium]|nr:hypothetical protein [Spirochaetota bacterium]